MVRDRLVEHERCPCKWGWARKRTQTKENSNERPLKQGNSRNEALNAIKRRRRNNENTRAEWTRTYTRATKGEQRTGNEETRNEVINTEGEDDDAGHGHGNGPLERPREAVVGPERRARQRRASRSIYTSRGR
ncbi:hypothetical protein PTI98_009229 [Pleurotus ostreatus]|nr:hypothetical protein PTI98_009229 [Pleurotus ostreatus]